MADDQNTAAQAVQSTPSAEGSETPQVESQVQSEPQTQDEGKVDQPGATSEDQDKGEQSSEETDNQSGQEAKPTRVEKRIQSLLSKVKEAGQTQAQQPRGDDGKPLIDQNQIDEDGRVDPNVLDQRIQQRVDTAVQKAIQMDRIGQQYESAVKEHQSDLEGVKDIDPELEAEAVAEYEAVNYQINPITGQREFVPAVKFSEIVNKIQTRAEKLAQKMAEKIADGNQEYLKKVSSSQAVPSSGAVSGSKSAKPDTTDFSEFEKQYSS